MDRDTRHKARLKYFVPLDKFIWIRAYTHEEVDELFKDKRIENAQAYKHFVIIHTVCEFEEEILPLIQTAIRSNPDLVPEVLEENLYRACIDVNSFLEIGKVSIPGSRQRRGKKPVDDASKLNMVKNLEKELKKNVIGQDQAIASLVGCIKRAEVGIRNPNKPVGSFLFVGSTGVGKTYLSKAIAAEHFNSHFLRVDCSEYAMPHEYSKLIGAPPGYIGHDDGGLLTNLVKTEKRAVILFDEIEKADKKLHNLLLQLMDEGRLSDGKGQVHNFNDCLIIMTSNLGVREAEDARGGIGFSRFTSDTQLESVIMSKVKDYFSPEFINRLDEIISFNPLTDKDLTKIAGLLLKETCQYVKESRAISVTYTSKVVKKLVQEGTSATYGARELRRTVEKQVQDLLTEGLINKKIKSSIILDVVDGEIVYLKTEKEKSAKTS